MASVQPADPASDSTTDDPIETRARVIDQVVKAYDIRGLVGSQLDATFVRDVGAAYARVLLDENALAVHRTGVVVGHDMRDSSPGLAGAFAAG